MVGRHQFEKRSPIKRLAFTELYLREVFGQSNLVETGGREKRQNLSNNLKKDKKTKTKNLVEVLPQENTSNRAACLNPHSISPKNRNAEGLKKKVAGHPRKNPK